MIAGIHRIGGVAWGWEDVKKGARSCFDKIGSISTSILGAQTSGYALVSLQKFSAICLNEAMLSPDPEYCREKLVWWNVMSVVSYTLLFHVTVCFPDLSSREKIYSNNIKAEHLDRVAQVLLGLFFGGMTIRALETAPYFAHTAHLFLFLSPTVYLSYLAFMRAQVPEEINICRKIVCPLVKRFPELSDELVLARTEANLEILDLLATDSSQEREESMNALFKRLADKLETVIPPRTQ